MLRVRPGVLLVRASFAPTSELITLDFPTFDRPRNAISGTPGAGKWVRSLADSINRARIRIQTVSSVWVAHGKRRGEISSQKMSWLEPERTFGFHVRLFNRIKFVPEGEATRDDESDENANQKEPAVRGESNQENRYYCDRDDETRRAP